MKMDEHSDPQLDPPFAALRAAMAQQNAPRGVEKELMDAFARQFPPRRWYHVLSVRQWWAAAGAGTAGLLAVLVLTMSAQVPSASPAAPATPLIAVDDGGPFMALASAERIEQEPDARLLETDVPRAELAALGVPVTPENAGDAVRAELLIGSDGSPLALRLASLP